MPPETTNREPRSVPLEEVAIVSPGWPLGSLSNGIVHYVAQARAALEAAGVNTWVLSLRALGVPEERVVSTRDHWPSGWWWSALRHLARPLAGRLRPSVAIARAAGSVGPGLQLLQLEESYGWARHVRRRLGIPVVVRLHGPWFVNGPMRSVPEDDAFRRRCRLEGLAIAEADGVSAPSQEVLDRTREHYGLDLPDAAVIPNARPLARPEDRWSADACRRGRILFVGRFDAHKGGDTVVDAFVRLSESVPDARLVMAGPDKGVRGADGELVGVREYIRAAAAGTPAEGKLEWLGEVPHDDLVGLRRDANLVVIASRYETFGNTVLEAISQGCPVIATRVGGIPEIIDGESSGLLVPADDPPALAAAMARLLQDSELAGRLSEGGLRACGENHSHEVFAAKTIEHYGRVLRAAR